MTWAVVWCWTDTSSGGGFGWSTIYFLLGWDLVVREKEFQCNSAFFIVLRRCFYYYFLWKHIIMKQSRFPEPKQNSKGSVCNNIQGLAASSMSSSGTYVLGSLLATRTRNNVYPYKLYESDYDSFLKRFLPSAKSPETPSFVVHAVRFYYLFQCLLAYPSYPDWIREI